MRLWWWLGVYLITPGGEGCWSQKPQKPSILCLVWGILWTGGSSNLMWGYRDPSSHKLGGGQLGVRCLVGGGGLNVLTWGPVPSHLSISFHFLPSHIPLSFIPLPGTHLGVRWCVTGCAFDGDRVVCELCRVWAEFETSLNSDSDFDFDTAFSAALLKSRKYFYMLSICMKTFMAFYFEQLQSVSLANQWPHLRVAEIPFYI